MVKRQTKEVPEKKENIQNLRWGLAWEWMGQEHNREFGMVKRQTKSSTWKTLEHWNDEKSTTTMKRIVLVKWMKIPASKLGNSLMWTWIARSHMFKAKMRKKGDSTLNGWMI